MLDKRKIKQFCFLVMISVKVESYFTNRKIFLRQFLGSLFNFFILLDTRSTRNTHRRLKPAAHGASEFFLINAFDADFHSLTCNITSNNPLMHEEFQRFQGYIFTQSEFVGKSKILR